MSRVFITGIGVISAIGNNAAENRRALLQGQCGITKLTNLPSIHAGVLPLGEINIATDTLLEKFPPRRGEITRTHLLAMHAAQEAIQDAGLTPSQLSAPDTALIGATTVGGLCLMDQFYQDVQRTTGGSPYLASYNTASVTMHLQAYYNMKGIVNTINTACSSSANAILYGARLIQHGLARRAIVGGADSLSKLTINGFNALRILSPEICTPFDRDRKGLNLGEGSAFLVLEREEDLAGKRAYASLAGYNNSNDAFHASSLSAAGDGPYLAMKGALLSAGLRSDQIDFINAHGTGTENNDEVESRAMLRLFESAAEASAPPFASTKSNIGHTLGASGAIEAVYSILNLTFQEVYAGLHFNQPIPSTGLQPVTVYKQQALQHVMSNSFGFGGNCTSLIFSKA